MRSELLDRIMILLNRYGYVDMDISQHLTIILSDYEISARETTLSVRTEDKNKYFMQKFLIAKTVKGCTDRTLQLYQNELWRILNFINKPADEITTDDIRLYLALRQKKDCVSKTTANNELRYLKSFFGYLTGEEVIQRNPAYRIDNIKCDKKKKNAFTEMEVEKLRNACHSTWESAVVEVLLSTGCRVSELCQIKINDIKGDQLIVHGKGNKDRVVYLNAKAILALERFIQDRRDSNPYLLPGGYWSKGLKDPLNWYKYPERVNPEEPTGRDSISAHIRHLGKRAGVEKVHPHRFRRTCATFALRRGMAIEQVSKMLGHDQINTTQIYLDLSEEDLKQAHKKYVI